MTKRSPTCESQRSRCEPLRRASYRNSA
jgi:hypothetical protein